MSRRANQRGYQRHQHTAGILQSAGSFLTFKGSSFFLNESSLPAQVFASGAEADGSLLNVQ
jgi:hypothetical protein